ncbi:MAG: hypothetical protein ABSF32_12500 [Ignavibacteria bacterium]
MQKSLYKIILPILFTAWSSVNYTNGQVIKDVPAGRLFNFDSAEVARIAEIMLENDMLRENQKLYEEKDSIYRADRSLFELKINGLQDVINLKEEQIKKFEMTPRIVEKKGWTWWQYTLAAIGTLATGFTAGIIYGMNH